MNIWLTSDNHFRHENIYRFTSSPGGPRVRERFKDATEGDAFMVQAWNERVRPQDHIWHLGDVTMERSSDMKKWFVAFMKQLHGHKRLVLGNHDHFTTDVYRDAGFQKIRGVHKLENLILSHVPLHQSSVPRWCIANVHGHIHEKPSPAGPYVNVSVERTGYAPIALEDVTAEAERLKKLYAPEVDLGGNPIGGL